MDVLDLLGHGLEIVIAIGLEQIAHSIGLIALDGIFAIGRDKDHQGSLRAVLCDGLGEVHAIEVRHIDVGKDGINILLFKHFLSLGSA